MAQPINNVYEWNANITYAKWDMSIVNYASVVQYFYSTVGGNLAANPTGQFVYAPLTSTRTDNVMRVTFTQTGTTYFQQGSVVVVSGIAPDSTVNYTGTVLAAGPGYVDYLNPGWNSTNVCTAGGVRAPIHPYWTTGFYWIPSWSTDITNNMAVINTKLGDGYEQRMNTAINSNSLSWNLVFAERSDKETMGLLTFLQVAGGATPFVLNFPVGNLYNAAGLKYISSAPRHAMTSYGLNQVTVPVAQVFDIG